MKSIRLGNYCLYSSYEFELIAEKETCRIVHKGNLNELLVNLGFQKYIDQVYILDLKCNDITSAYHVETFCIYKGFKFLVEQALSNGKYRILPLDEAQKNLDDTSKQGYDPVYEADESEIEAIWEERQSFKNFKFDAQTKIFIKGSK